MIKTHPSIRNGPTNILFSLQSVVDHSPDLLLGESPSSCSLSDRVRWGMKALTNWITTSHPHFVLCIAPTTQQVTLFPSEENTCNLISTTQSLVGLYKGLFFSFPFFSLSSASPLPLLLPLSSPSPPPPLPPPSPPPPPPFLPLSSPSQGGEFDGGLVLHQLQQLRVLDTALIQSCGYPVHMSYSTFTQQYGVLLLRGTHLQASRETCQHVLETTRLEEWRLGKSQVRSLSLMVCCLFAAIQSVCVSTWVY